MNIKDQTRIVLINYIEYVDNKVEMGELPLSFDQWAEIEISEKSPISVFIEP